MVLVDVITQGSANLYADLLDLMGEFCPAAIPKSSGGARWVS